MPKIKCMKNIRISGYTLNKNADIFLVAEIGLNHNADINLAKQSIIKAKQCGADAVKFQVYDTDLFINKKYDSKAYQLMKRYELSRDNFNRIKKFCDKRGIIFFASPFDLKSLQFLLHLKVPVIKIASGEFSNVQILKAAAESKVPLFLSTGLHDFKEVNKTVKWIEKINQDLVIFHCVSDYPLKSENANMNVITQYKNEFDHFIGFSDHSEGWMLDVMALSLGVKVIEKHFTLDKQLQGPDHRISLDPAGFTKFAEKVRSGEKALGEYFRKITENEEKIRAYAFKGIYASRNIKKSEKFSIDNIILQRPVSRINSKEIFKILGKRARKEYSKFETI